MKMIAPSLRRFARCGAALACSLIFLPTFILPTFAAVPKALPDLVQYVNTLQGTDSHWGFSYGNTYPSTTMPYPMHSWSPQTGQNGDGWKYKYNALNIRGFQQVHQCSPWMGDYAVLALMPQTGTLCVNEHRRGYPFTHENEVAKPHYYAVTFNNGLRAEVAPTERAAHLRFTFPAREAAYLVLDGYTRDSHFDIDLKGRRITGWVNNGTHLNKREAFRCYFVMEFDQPLVACGLWDTQKGQEDKLYPGQTQGTGSGKGSEKGHGAYVQFKPGAQVQVKVSSSYISPDQALRNLRTEVGADKSLDQTRARGFETWNALLNRVQVEGGTPEERATFYSCLFRANLFSHKLYELKEDGTPYYYSPYDGQVHDGYMYSDNGFWDTFRSQFPLTNLLHPTLQGRYMQAILDMYDQYGWLPAWSNPGENGGMIGNHAISLLCDAWAKGIRTFDPAKALEAYAHDSMNKGPGGSAGGRAGWKEYWTLGYCPFTPKTHGSSAWTLEYAYDDWCAYRLAQMTGNSFYQGVFARSMYNYKNLWNPATGFMGARDEKGAWVDAHDPYLWGGPYTEGNAWHYLWSVFHDPQGLIDLFGGNAPFVAKLDSLFTVPNTVKPGYYGGIIHEMKEMEEAHMGQYAHGNQPVQHVTYLYSYAGAPWKTQERVREVMDRLYNATEKGYPGDEDQGGLSSWYVLSALGLYAVCPGTDQYVIGSPLFEKTTLRFENGKTLVIEAVNNSKENKYIQEGSFNGKNLDKNFLTYAQLMEGGTLRFVMGPRPNTARNTGPEAAPYSVSRAQ